MQKENGELKGQLDKKASELVVTTTNFNTKIRDYDGYVKRTN